MRLSLVIPCYNEGKSLPTLFKRCQEVLQAAPDIEIILVDNGSTDETPAAMRQLIQSYPGIRTLRIEKNQGYGFGILSGLRAATGDILAWTHADMQTDPMDAVRGLQFFKEAKDHAKLFVKGRRYGRPFADVIFMIAMGLFETALLRQPLWDINAQPNMFPRQFFERLHNPPHDFALDLFVYYQARAMGLNVKRFPVYFGPREHGVSHWNFSWQGKLKFIRRTMAFSWQLRRSLRKNVS